MAGAKKKPGRPPVPVEQRFWAKVRRGREDECWEWTAGSWVGREPNKYPTLDVNGRRLLAGKVAWELTNGPVPEGTKLYRQCTNTACCNPGHMKVGVASPETADRVSKALTGRVMPPGQRKAISAGLIKRFREKAKGKQ
jgi:hypothetical protein